MKMAAFRRYAAKSLYAAKIALATCRIMGMPAAVKYWISSSSQQPLSVGSIKLLVNGKTFREKMVDTCMALECAYFHNYTPNDKFRIGKNDTVIDIGGHIGSFSVFAAQCAANGKVYSFEPSPKNRGLLQRNAGLNNLRNVEVSGKAVAGKKGRVKIYLNEENSAENGLYFKGATSIIVDTTTLSAILKENKIQKCHFLKVDCEGAEYDILLNADKATLQKIDRIALEYHAPEHFNITDGRYSVKNLNEHLKKNGFRTTIKKVNFYQGMLFAWR